MELDAIADLVHQVQAWPTPMRISLARQILESVEREPGQAAALPTPRGPIAAEVAARFRSHKPAPDDQTVKQWIDEHRATRYGS